MDIRAYSKSDWPMLRSWWGNNEATPIEEMLPDTTFIIEANGTPIASACLLLTNNRYACMIEHLIADPDADKGVRREAVQKLFLFLEKEAQSRGYRGIVLFSYVAGLKARYEQLGFKPTQSDITTFAKLF